PTTRSDIYLHDALPISNLPLPCGDDRGSASFDQRVSADENAWRHLRIRMSNGQDFDEKERERKVRRKVFYLTFAALVLISAGFRSEEHTSDLQSRVDVV